MRCASQFVSLGRGSKRASNAVRRIPCACVTADVPRRQPWGAVSGRLLNSLARRAAWLPLAFALVAVVPTGFVDTATAATLDRITAIERNRNIVTVGTEELRVTAESRFSEATATTDQPAVITFQSLSVGDYVVVERDGSVIKSLQRVDPASIDMPAAIPLPVRPGRDP